MNVYTRDGKGKESDPNDELDSTAASNADAFLLLFFCYTGIHDDLSLVWHSC